MKLIFTTVTACLLVLVSPSVEALLAGNPTCRWYPLIKTVRADNKYHILEMGRYKNDDKTRNTTFRRSAVLDTF